MIYLLRNCLEIPTSGAKEAWRYLKPHLPVSAVGRPREVSMRQVVNAIPRLHTTIGDNTPIKFEMEQLAKCA